VLKLKNHANNLNFVHLLPEDRHLALTSCLNVVKVWDLRVGKCVTHLLSSGLVEDGTNQPIARDTGELPMSEFMIYKAAVDAEDKFMFTTYGTSIRMWNLEKLQGIGSVAQNHK